MVMTALGEGVGVAVATRIFGHSEFTIQTWLTWSGLHAQSLRHDVSTLVRRSCGKAQLVGEMTLHLEWFRAYYQFVRPHASLREPFQTSMPLQGRAQRYRQRTPAMVAGITSHCWSVLEVLSIPIPPCPKEGCVLGAADQ